MKKSAFLVAVSGTNMSSGPDRGSYTRGVGNRGNPTEAREVILVERRRGQHPTVGTRAAIRTLGDAVKCVCRSLATGAQR